MSRTPRTPLRRRKLGELTLTAYLDEKGTVNIEHATSLSTDLNTMQAAMDEVEKASAMALRRKVCAAAARFFLFVRNPDAPVEVRPHACTQFIAKP